MIKRFSGIVCDSNPQQYPWYWWCSCGNTEKGAVEYGKTKEQIAYKREMGIRKR